MSKLDMIHGIDRYKDSQTYGMRVVKFASIWKTPAANEKVGEIQHGMVVNILDNKKARGASWHKVKSCNPEGKWVTGWLRTSLLLYAGESEFTCPA